MVQLKKSTIPRRNRLRGSAATNNSVTPREWTILLVIFVGCTYLLSSFLGGGGDGSSGGSSATTGAGGPGGVRVISGHEVAHGRGRRVPELSDAYNAIANDVIRVLDCAKAVPEGGYYYDGADGGGAAFSGDEPDGGGGMWDDYIMAGGGGDGAGAAAGAGAAGDQQQKFLDDDGVVPNAVKREEGEEGDGIEGEGDEDDFKLWTMMGG